MKRTDRKSDCAINFFLEVFGDPWSLLIVRDIVYFGKRTFGEFLASDERIGTSVLAHQLANLENQGVLTRHTDPTDGRKEVYELTERGLDLIPVLVDLAEWGAAHDPRSGANRRWMTVVRHNRDAVIKLMRITVRRGNAAFGDAGTVPAAFGFRARV